MPLSPFDQTVLEMIEHSPVGAVPLTPAYQDALSRLKAAHQLYASADHKDGHATAHALGGLPSFHAANLNAWGAGEVAAEELESNSSIFDRYVQSLPEARRKKAESFRLKVVGRPVHHRAKLVGETKVVAHDPVHTLFLVPGAGPHPGLPGNYLHGSLYQAGATGQIWAVQLHDSDDGAAVYDASDRASALAKMQETLASAPFHLDELGELGFRVI